MTPGVRLTMPVAQWLLALAGALCGPEVCSRVVEPLVADWHREWNTTGGVRRAAAAISGAFAYTWCVTRFVSLAQVVAVLPLTGFAITLGIFAIGAALLMLQPLQYMWVGGAPTFQWLGRPLGFYILPTVASISLTYALLPATLLIAYNSRAARKAIAASLITLALILVIEGWIAPAVGLARHREFLARVPRAARFFDPRRYANTFETVTLARDADPKVALEARQRLRNQLQLLVIAISFAIFGLAVGRVRAASHCHPRFVSLVGWWLFAWLAYHALSYWGQFGLMMLGLSRTAQPWVAPVVFVALSGAVILAARASPPSGCPG